jgi:hypothetical protein
MVITVMAGAGHAGVRDIRTCLEENMPRLSTIQKLALDVEEGGEILFESRLTLYWRRLDNGERRIVLRFREPEDLAGASLLIQQMPRRRPSVYIYLPDQGKPRAISGRGELEGFLGRANLGIDELELLISPLSDKKITVLDEAADLVGRAVWVTEEQKPADTKSRYKRTVTFIDHEFCVPLRAEFYGKDDTTAKLLEIDPASVTRVEQSWVPMRLVFRDLIRETNTILRVEDAEVDTALAPSLLTLESLPRLSR